MKIFILAIYFVFAGAEEFENSEDFAQDVLSNHNNYRKIHGIHNLTISHLLSQSALNWATHLANETEGMGKNITLYHSVDQPEVGENIYVGWGKGFPLKLLAKFAVDYWYNEIEFYTFENGTFSPETSHFTQLIWKESTHLGVGVSSNSNGYIYVVTHYSPRGNIIGKFKENVLPPLNSAINNKLDEGEEAVKEGPKKSDSDNTSTILKYKNETCTCVCEVKHE